MRLRHCLALIWFPFLVPALHLQALSATPLRLEGIGHVPSALNLRWTGGDGPFAIERSDQLPSALWETDLTTTQRTANLPASATSGFYRVVDLGTGVPESCGNSSCAASAIPPELVFDSRSEQVFASILSR